MSESYTMAQAATVEILDNGMTVALEHLPYLRSASIAIWIRTGSAHETPEENGIAHFIEHLLFKGTEKRTAHDIMDAIESRGGHFNAFTSRGYTCYYVRILEQHTAAAIEVLADIVKNSIFHDMDKERGVILEEIATNEDTPDDFIHDLLALYHWPDHALGRPIAGSAASVTGITKDMVRDFSRRWYNPANMYFVISGNIDTEAVLGQLREEFSPLPGSPVAQPDSAPVFQAGIEGHERDIAQAHLTLAFPGPKLATQERFVADLTSMVLGGGSTSRLFERIREDEGLAYNIQTFSSYYPTAGMLGVYAAVAPENYRKTLDLTFQEIRKVRDEGVPQKELDACREQIKGYTLMSLESTFSRGSRMAKSLMLHGRIVPIEELIEQLEAVTTDDVQAFAAKTFRPENTAHVVLAPASAGLLEAVAL
ncbi:MAG: insulinase family protein [Candidatus Hydrogenedens sp.]|nr:insulinase family protein [Candidatus Hydrogenedens sp.]